VREPLNVKHYSEHAATDSVDLDIDVCHNGVDKQIKGHGNGIIDAFCKALESDLNVKFDIVNYSEHSMDYGNKSRAITYIQLYDKDQNSYYGVGISSNIAKSSLRAIVSAVNKMNN
jgi:2-isopropylmalate synthase